MDLASNYEIARTAQFIHEKSFAKVALQFPDELLKDSTKVVSALRVNLQVLISESDAKDDGRKAAELFVMADTTYGSCCVDEVGASHVDADCIVHYGHTCLSPTSTLPALFIFGKAIISDCDCARSLSDSLSTSEKPILVLYGLEYAHAIHRIKESVGISSTFCGSKSNLVPCYANVVQSVMYPSEDNKTCVGQMGSSVAENRYSIGGLTWALPVGFCMEDYMIFWIGSNNAAFANVALTFNSNEIVRYDPMKNHLVKDSSQNKILKRRYYLVEKAKDSNIIGILVGTLGVAGYRHMINQMKEMITGAGKKAYTLVMGKPNPAKLANFPECDVFVYVSCAQTALLDSKEFFAPVITPFEAILAFRRGSQWTGSYVLEFRDLIDSSSVEVNSSSEPRFSLLQGGYAEEDFESQVNGEEEDERANALAEVTQRALQVHDKYSQPLVKGTAKSGVEFFSARSYHGLDMQHEDPLPQSFVVGRTGKASGYEFEKNK
ncbi:2-(3-amino-3-carboxypropyl)histidine synthase subunit [Thalictrum thalictroides]|uniref:2-(3-amino-3-carboxypropyl)histidine synthase subunit 2 n=1 Tax=Thalictrum thalictroides TaxID=46969 RepID=A0A7J6W098_THATH|nr:2-(3-amino-3-carboxypropyl)histidine synthase subunit [Thalictrum thalictroides]